MPAGSVRLPENVNEILRSHSKPTRRRACYPCYLRKVGCDGGRPCKRCIDRDHSSLCNYEPGFSRGRKRRAQGTGTGGRHSPAEMNSHSQRLGLIDSGSREVNLSHSGTGRQPELNAVTGQRNHEEASTESEGISGRPSVPESILDNIPPVTEGSGNYHSDLRSLLLPALGLQSARSGSKAGLPRLSSYVQRALDLISRGSEVSRMFQWYKIFVFPLNPHLIDITTFETELVAFINKANSIKAGQVDVPSSDWLANFFAVLAAGTQFSHHPFDKRTADSKVYAHDAFACLHAEFGYITPSLSTIRTLIILITVLQNNQEAEVAWSYLGLASRLAQSVGLDRGSTATGSSLSTSDLSAWQAIVWQDSLLSMCLGRRPCTTSNTTPIEEERGSQLNMDYRRAMYELASSSLHFVDEQNASSTLAPSPTRMLEYASRLQRLLEHVKPEIQFKERSSSIANSTECLALRLNLSCALAMLLRPSLEEKPEWLACSEQRNQARKMCIDACMAAVDSFVNLHLVSPVAERSWAFLHNGLSCALILLLIDEGSRNHNIRDLQKRLLNIVSTASSEADQASPLWGPHARILSVFNLLESARSSRPSTLTAGQRATDDPLAAEPCRNIEQETSDADPPNLEPGYSDMSLPHDDSQFSFYLSNLSNANLGDDGLIGMYDSILWGNNNFI